MGPARAGPERVGEKMLFITGALVGMAWLLSRTSVRRAVPFESVAAGMLAGGLMVALLVTGRLT